MIPFMGRSSDGVMVDALGWGWAGLEGSFRGVEMFFLSTWVMAPQVSANENKINELCH